MAFKGRVAQGVDYTRLKSTLAGSPSTETEDKLYQVITGLINGAEKFKDQLDGKADIGSRIEASQLEGVVAVANGGTYGELYVPTLTLVSNLTGAGVSDFYYYQNGRLVTVFGKVQVTPTVGATITELGMSLPVISYFKFDYQCAGSANSPTINQGAAIVGDVGNNRALLKFLSTGASTFDLFFQFGYVVIEK
jgi:hypothetical protein